MKKQETKEDLDDDFMGGSLPVHYLGVFLKLKSAETTI